MCEQCQEPVRWWIYNIAFRLLGWMPCWPRLSRVLW